MRDKKRQEVENNNDNRLKLRQYFIGNYYWPFSTNEDTDDRETVSSSKWMTGTHLDFEEIRTIIGAPVLPPEYKEGDDLSDNLYRLSVNMPIRFGHDNVAFYEDKEVITRVINTCVNSYSYYNNGLVIDGEEYINNHKLRYEDPTVQFEYEEGEEGLRGCRIKSPLPSDTRSCIML